jgi:hypothetical protein
MSDEIDERESCAVMETPSGCFDLVPTDFGGYQEGDAILISLYAVATIGPRKWGNVDSAMMNAAKQAGYAHCESGLTTDERNYYFRFFRADSEIAQEYGCSLELTAEEQAQREKPLARFGDRLKNADFSDCGVPRLTEE